MTRAVPIGTGPAVEIARAALLAQTRPPHVLVSRYRCRDHHGQAVNWRGVGCGKCPRATHRRPKRRTLQRGEVF